MRFERWQGGARRRAHAGGGRPLAVAPVATAVFFALTFVVYFFVEPYLGAVNNPNENTRTYLTMAIVEHHTFRLDEIVRRQGWVGDLGRAPEKEVPSKQDASARIHAAEKSGPIDPRLLQNIAEGKFYISVKAPAVSYFGVPFYWLMTKVAPHLGHPVPTDASTPLEKAYWLRASTFVLRVCAVQLPCFLFLVWFERWLRRTTEDVILRLSTVAAVAFGSNFLAYSLMFVSHALSAVAAFLAFGLILRTRLDSLGDSQRRRAGTAFVVGFLIGMVPLLEYTAPAVAVILGVYGLATFWRPRQLLAFAFGGLIDVLALTHYQAHACETWTTPCPKFAEGFAWLHNKTFGFGKPSWAFIKEASLSHSSGFFGMSPFMWLGMLAIPFGLFWTFGTRRERRERRVATVVWALSMLALWVFVSAASNPHGGWSIGPRYLGAAPPFFAFGAALALEKVAQRAAPLRVLSRALAGGALLASAAQVGLVSLVYNTVTETTARPLMRLALPLIRAGFVPYDIGGLFGSSSLVVWYIAAGALAVASLLAALAPARDTPWRFTFRLAGVLIVAAFGIEPALRPLGKEEPNDVRFPGYLASVWEPPHRDRLTKTREAAERRGADQACLWYTVAAYETDLGMTGEAARDEKRAGVPRNRCP
jgi:hypothetical protein